MSSLHSKALDIVISALLVLIALALLFSHTPFGVAFSMDSLSYLSAAQQFGMGNGVSLPLYDVAGEPYSPMALWPPLYPLILSLLPENSLFSVYIGKLLFLVNAFALLVLLLAFLQFVRTLFQVNWMTWVAMLMLLALPSIQIIYIYAWSETFFIPVVFASFCAFSIFLKRPRLVWLVVAVALLAAGFYLRYAALGFLAGLLLSLLLLGGLQIRTRILYIVCAISVFAILVVPLLVRNYWLTQTLVGRRSAASASILNDVISMLKLFSADFSPFSIINGLICVAIVGLGLHIYRRRAVLAGDTHPIKVALVSAIWIASYLFFLVVNRQLSHMDMDTRMIAPVMPLVVLVLSGLLWGGVRLVSWRESLWVFGLLPLLMVINLVGVHRELVSSWRMTGAPGHVLGITYNSITNKDLEVFFRLREVFVPNKADLLLTDLDRPQILQYFFPRADIKQLPANLSPADLAQAGYLHGRSGLLVMTKSSTMDMFASALVSPDAFLQVQESKGTAYNNILLLRLPLQALK